VKPAPPTLETPCLSVTTTAAFPADPAGVFALISVSETISTSFASAPPILTVDSSLKPVPLIVTLLAPAVDPSAGVTDVTVGGVT
jgi:hypothetical protein